MSQIRPGRIRYRYTVDRDARLNVAHGVWGGVNPQGEIELNFYHESDAVPAEVECLLAPDGSLGPETPPSDDMEVRRITRHIHSRILLNYDTACAVLEWLDDRITSLEMEDGEAPAYDDPGRRQ